MTDRPAFFDPSEAPPLGKGPDAERRREAFEAEAWLRAIVENSGDAILSKTLDGIITTWNAGAEKLYGYTAEEAIGQPITVIIPDDRLDEEERILGELRAGKRVENLETVRRCKDGSLVDVALTVSPVKDEAGNVLGASKIARDISTARQAAARQDLIIREMNHRIKNLFALTTSLVALSARNATDVGELVGDLTARLQSLSRAHALTLPDLYEEVFLAPSTSLITLIKQVLAPHDDEAGTRISVEGDAVSVGPHAVPTLGLLFHELATNATKYGALASADGRLTIDVRVDSDAVEIRWRESGGPERDAGAPLSQGFGSRLEQASVSSLRGSIDRDWHEGGLGIVVRFPLAEVAR